MWQRIKIARTSAKLTQTQLAERCGNISREAVSQWESRDPDKRTTPQLDRLRMIADATSVSMDWLLTGTGDIAPAASPAPPPPPTSEPTAPGPDLTPRQRVVLDLFDGLTAAQQDALIRELEEKKRLNDDLLTELLSRRRA